MTEEVITANLDMMSDDTRKAIEDLHKLFESQLELAAKPGLVAEPNIWVKVARKLYNDGNRNQVNPKFSSENRLFYLIHIDEYLAGLQGTAYLNLHAQGVMYNNFGTSLQSGCMVRFDNVSYFEAFSWPLS